MSGGFFYLIKSDRLSLWLLLLLISLASAFFILTDSENQDSGGGNQEGGDKTAEEDTARRPSFYYNVEERKAETFPFDPNTADSTMLLRLGLRPWQVKNIYKYRSRGGVYRKKEDFARLYGLTVKDYRRLEPYIRIGEDYLPAAAIVRRHSSPPASSVREGQQIDSTRRYPVKLKETEHISLNGSDTLMLRRVPGIGAYFARAIVNYRERLGGYVSLEQLLEINNFPQKALPYFTLDITSIRKINLNRASVSVMVRHPYISYRQARAISDYRRLHGSLSTLEELSTLSDFSRDVIHRLSPYVEF